VSEPALLEYGGYEKPRPISRKAVIALIAGILCGPAGFALGWLGAISGVRDPGAVILLALLISHAGILVFCISAFDRLHPPANKRGRYLALWGIIATICWAVAIFAFLIFVVHNLD
jgi:hypothetical protein